MDVAQITTLLLGVLGAAGLVLTALRFNRDDTTAIVTQQSTLTAEMKTLNDELRTTATTLRSERDRCHGEVTELRKHLQQIESRLDGG